MITQELTSGLQHSGDLPAVRFGRSLRVERGAVEALIRGALFEAG